jgi:hypothetical protein
MSPLEQQREVGRLQQQLADLPQIPHGLDLKETAKKTAKGLWDMLTIITGILNIPSAAISGAAKQIADGAPGFDAQEYFRDVFKFKEQVMWRDVINILAEKDPNKNMWDNKWAQIIFGLTLDIVLDPLTYFGVGPWTKALKADDLTKVLVRVGQDATEKAVKNNLTDIPKYVNRALGRANRKLTTSYGFRLPFTRRVMGDTFKGKKIIDLVKKSPDEIAEAMVKAIPKEVEQVAKYGKALRGRQFKRFAVQGIAEKRTTAQMVSDFAERWVPGYKWAWGAITSKRQAVGPVIQAKDTMLNKIGSSMDEVMEHIDRIYRTKGITPEIQAAIPKYWSEPRYINAEAMDIIHKQQNLLGKTIADVQAGKIGRPEAIRALYEANKEWDSAVIDSTLAWLRNNRADITLKGLARNAQEIMDSYGIHKFYQFGVEAGLPFEDMSTLVGLRRRDTLKPFKEVFPEIYKKIPEEQRRSVDHAVNYARALLDRIHIEAVKKGIPLKYRDVYMPDIKFTRKMTDIPPEYGEAVNQWWMKEKVSKATSERRLHNLAKQVYHMGAAKSEEHARKLLLAGKVEGYERVMQSITEVLYNRMSAHYKTIHYMDFLEQVKRWGTPVPKNVAKIVPPHMQITRIDELKGLMFDQHTRQYIERAADILSTNESVAKFIKATDRFTSWWKVMAYSQNIGAHFRNFYSNHFIGSVWQGIAYANPKRHAQAMKIMLYANRRTKIAQKAAKLMGISDINKVADEVIGGTKYTVKELVNNYLPKTGLLKRQYRFLDVRKPQKFTKYTESSAKKILRKTNIAYDESVLADLGNWLGSHVESEARIAAWLTDLRHTDDPIRSAWRTNEVFVNYNNLTEFESKIAMRVFPFWTWLKQNTANQIRFIFTQPGSFSKLPKFKGALEAGAKEKLDEKLQPAYFKELWMWQLPITLPDGSPLFFNPNFPFQDLQKLSPTAMRRTIMTSANPMLKLPIEMATGIEFFKMGKIRKYPGYKRPAPGITPQYTNSPWYRAG